MALCDSIDAYAAIYDVQEFPPRYNIPARAMYVPASDLAVRRLRLPSACSDPVLVVYHHDNRSLCDKLLARLDKDEDFADTKLRKVHVASMEKELLRKWPSMRTKRIPPSPPVCKTAEDWTKMPQDVHRAHYLPREPSSFPPHVFVGHCDDVLHADGWDFKRVVHVCHTSDRDCLCKTSMDVIHSDPEHHLLLRIDDVPDADISQHFEEVNAFLAKAERLREGVIVHCFAGMSRSPTLVLAYMMRVGMTFDEAYELLAMQRPLNINLGFMAQLRAYEKKLQEEKH
jgi:hypothetical protein